MKAKYMQPTLEVVNFTTEDAVLLTTSGTTVDTNDKDFQQRSNKKDMWGNKSMWD